MSLLHFNVGNGELREINTDDEGPFTGGTLEQYYRNQYGAPIEDAQKYLPGLDLTSPAANNIVQSYLPALLNDNTATQQYAAATTLPSGTFEEYGAWIRGLTNAENAANYAALQAGQTLSPEATMYANNPMAYGYKLHESDDMSDNVMGFIAPLLAIAGGLGAFNGLFTPAATSASSGLTSAGMMGAQEAGLTAADLARWGGASSALTPAVAASDVFNLPLSELGTSSSIDLGNNILPAAYDAAQTTGATGMDLSSLLSPDSLGATIGDLNSVGGGDLSWLDAIQPNLANATTANSGTDWLSSLLNGTTTDLANTGALGAALTGNSSSGLPQWLSDLSATTNTSPLSILNAITGGNSGTTGTSSTANIPSWLIAALGGTALAGVLGDKAQTSSSTATTTPVVPAWLDTAQQNMAGKITSVPTVAPQYTQPLAAGLSQNQQSGIGMADSVTGAWAPQYAQAVQKATQAATTLPETDLSQYMNPYMQQVLAPQLRGINQQYDNSGNQLNLASASHGAFGGTRNALLGGLNEQNRGTALSDAIGKGYGDAYNYATTNALADRTSLLNSANTLGNLATGYQTNLGKDVSQLMSTGQTAQTTQQNAYDKAYQDYLTQLQYPLTATQGLSSALSSVAPRTYANSVTTNSTGAQPNTAANLFGAGTTLTGLLGQMGYFNT